MHVSGSVCQDSLSVRVPCLIPSRLSGWEPLAVKRSFLREIWRLLVQCVLVSLVVLCFVCYLCFSTVEIQALDIGCFSFLFLMLFTKSEA